MNKKVMQWLDLLPGVETTNFQFQRDQIDEMLNEAAKLEKRAKFLKGVAYTASCGLQAGVESRWTSEVVEKAKEMTV